MTTIGDTVTAMQNITAQEKLKQKEANGPSTELDQDAFLTLMIEQLKNQDPTNAMDSTQMLTQQAQFTQISELQKMNSTLTSNSMITQATSLVGKEVTLVDPDDTTKTITGTVSSANFTSSAATVTVNGKDYPLGLVISIGTEAEADSGTGGTADGGPDTDTPKA